MEKVTRVAVSADDGTGLGSIVSPHFGRCPYYVLVDLDDREVTAVAAIENPYYGQHQPGQVPQFIREQGVDVMLTGGMGQRALRFFEAYGIQAVTGASGTVGRSLEQYLVGALADAQPCRESVEHAHDVLTPHGPFEEDQVGRLREELEMLQQQLDDATTRLRNIAQDA